MLNYKNTIIVSFIILTLIFIIDLFNKVSPWIYFCIILITVSLFIYGSIFIKSGFYIKALCSAPLKKKSVAITFDDGPDEKTTPLILKILMEKKVSAAFFCIGKKVKNNPLLIKKIYDEGHIIGGHSFNHSNFFDIYSSKRVEQEITDTENEIKKIIGKKIKLFRPPYGVTNPNLAKTLKNKDCYVIGWSIRTNDTVLNEEKILTTIKKKLKGGDIILFHDTMMHTVNVLPQLIDYIRERDFNIERLDNLLEIHLWE